MNGIVPMDLSKQGLASRYAIALGLIGLLSVAAYWNIRSVIRTQENMAAVVNLSGRQRMLSQRITAFALHYATTGDEALRRSLRADLERMTETMRASHEILLYGSPERGIPPTTSQEVKNLLLRPPGALDPSLREFWAGVRALLDSPPEEREASLQRLLVAGGDDLLQRLDTVVQGYQRESEREIARLHRPEGYTLATVLAVLLLEWLFIFRPMVRRIVADRAQLEQANEQLQKLAVTDQLTGCFNRLKFEEVIGREQALSKRHGEPLGAMLLDIDHFKAINDGHGHETGDAVLLQLADTVRACLRKSDYFIRWGGEEFLVLLPRTGIEEAVVAAEKIRTRVEAHPFTEQLRLTVSIGVGEWIVDEPSNHLLSRIDEALYAAKKLGRNRVQPASAGPVRG